MKKFGDMIVGNSAMNGRTDSQMIAITLLRRAVKLSYSLSANDRL